MKKLLWVLAILALAFGIGVLQAFIAERHRPPDDVQIRRLIAEGKDAIEHKNLKRAMACVAKDYTDEWGLTHDELRAEMTAYFTQQGTYKIQLKNTSIRVLTRTAVVETHATMYLVYPDGGGKEQLTSRPVQLILIREPAKRWLLLPTWRWKVTNTAGLPSQEEIEDQEGI